MSVLDLSADQYHADVVADRPTLSASIAKVLLAASPAHAWSAHPRLNPQFEKTADEKFDLGTCAHALFLEGDAAVEIIDAPDWRTAAAKEARQLARENGRIPLLAKDWDRVQEIVGELRGQIDQVDAHPPLFADGKAEQTVIWDDSGVACRARLDWLRDDRSAIDDLKTTSRSANPEQWSRQLFGMGYDIQAAVYVRGVRALTGSEPAYRLVVVETSPPYAISVLSLSPVALELANAKVDRAVAIWKQCLAEDSWPSYPARVATVDLPAWEETRWLEREAREEMVA